MPQMVLPQTPMPEFSNDTGSGKAAGRGADDRDSRFDSVSRQEQKRLSRQSTERAEARARTDEQRGKSAQDTRSRSAPPEHNTTVKPQTGSASTVAKAGDAETSEAADSPYLAFSPITFAELQAMVASSATGAEGKPVLPPNGELAAAVVTPGQKSLAGTPGTAGAAVSAGAGAPDPSRISTVGDLIAGSLGAEPSKPSELATLTSGSRLTGTLELVAQQAAPAASRLPAEAASAPLRSYTTSIDLPVGHAEWGDKMVGKLSWLTARNMSVAEIHLTPPDLGPMEVRVRVQNDQANITVHAANPVVRDQLELHSHRLRDMLGEQGLALAQFDVSDQSQQQSGEQGEAGADGHSGSGQSLAAADHAEADLATGALDLSWQGEVDVFA